MSESELRQTLYYNYAEATEKNMSKNEEKILHLKSATRLVFASLIAFFVLALLLVIKGH